MISNLFKIQNPAVREVLEWVEIFVIAFLITLVLRSFIIEPTLVSGHSMEPNLHDGDRLIVNRFLPYFSNPQRGEIVVFNYSKEKSFIKRVIGVPDDVIDLRKNSSGNYYDLYRNGELVEENYIKEKITTPGDNDFPIKVTKDHFFVMGDNRNNSFDSRFKDVGENGLVSKSILRGPVFFRFWPLSRFGGMK